MPLYTLIEQNSDVVDVNFISRNNFNNNAYRGNLILGLFLVIPLIIMVIPMEITYNNNRNTSDLENNIK